MQYLDTQKRGKFIVFYGPNNIGKSTQVSLLASKLINEYHKQLLVLKYPLYELNGSGPEINRQLRDKNVKNKLSPDKLQKLYAKNRMDFQHVIESCIKSGVNVIAEDYLGTGIAWGMTNNVSLKKLLKYNEYLLLPDLAILLDGKRFSEAIEKDHIHEDAGDKVWKKNRQVHLDLAEKFGWEIVKSDNTVEEVQKDIWKLVKPIIH